MDIVATNMGWPMFGDGDEGFAVEVGERKPPSDGVKTGVGMDGGMSSKSSKRSKFDFTGGRGSGFPGLVDFVGFGSSSELDESESDSVSALVRFITGALGFGLAG